MRNLINRLESIHSLNESSDRQSVLFKFLMELEKPIDLDILADREVGGAIMKDRELRKILSKYLTAVNTVRKEFVKDMKKDLGV